MVTTFCQEEKKMNRKGNRILNTQVHRNHGSVIFQRNQPKTLLTSLQILQPFCESGIV